MFSTRVSAEYVKKLRIELLNKHGLLSKSYSSARVSWEWGGVKSSIGLIVSLDELNHELGNQLRGIVILHYVAGNQRISCNIGLTTTSCNYGNFRYWFMCPKCFQRIGMLYLYGGNFACRHCHNLTYESRKLNGFQKKAGRIISFDELETAENKVKRKYYAGKMTRKYRQYLRLDEKFMTAYRTGVLGLAIRRGIISR